jgi:hypothetical protein
MKRRVFGVFAAVLACASSGLNAAEAIEYKVFRVHLGKTTVCPYEGNTTCFLKDATEQSMALARDGWEIIAVLPDGETAAKVWARRPKTDS